MFRTPTVEAFAGEPAVRKLLHFVLLMAARDRARAFRFEPSSALLQMWYCCPSEEGTLSWYTLVPVESPALWEQLVAVFRETCEFLPLPGWFDERDRGLFARFGGLFGKKTPTSEAYPHCTTLVHQIGTYRDEWSLLLDTRRSIPSALLIPMSERPDSDTAGDLLTKLLGRDGTVEL
jgi:hypothetical protein